jgi:serine/threonine protein kinase/tetratricopeptide (TPR) repeat protein
MLSDQSNFGPYRVISLLGSGAMGDVYRALDTRLDREVALKLIRAELAASTEYRERLAEEARAAARVDSPFVVKIWEYSAVDDVPYLSMEFVEGQELLAAISGLATAGILAHAGLIAEGVLAAHRAGLIHGDLKPENIKSTPNGSPKILDFGLAKPARANPIDRSGQIAGTLYYLAPEQLTGGAPSQSTDLFSLGVVFYEMLTGKRPFEGDHPAAVAYAILHEDPNSLRESRPDLPLWADSMILSLLAKNPSDRPAGADDLVKRLRRHLSGESIGPGPVTTGRAKNVTVIDLRNLSGDPSWEYFCEGFTDDIISELSRRSDLVVSAQPSKDMPRDIAEVFRRVRSDFVLSGSLGRLNDAFQLRLTLHTDGGRRLVSEKKYVDRVDNLFGLLSEAARETVGILEAETGGAARQVEDIPSTDVTAYDYYLQGKSYYQTNKPESLEFSGKMFRRALEIDPDYALAHAGLADLYVFQYMAYYDRSEARLEEARIRALRALEIDPSLPEAHRALGRYYMFSGNMAEAKKSFRTVVELNPKYAIGYRTLAWLRYQGQEFETCLEAAQLALRLAPTDTETLLLIGLCHTCLREYTAATVTLQRALEVAPDYGRAYYNLALVFQKMGVLEAAVKNFELACKYEGDPNCFVDAGWALFLLKDYDRARLAYRKALDKGYFPFIAAYNYGFLEKVCGNDEEAGKLFQLAISNLQDYDYSIPDNVQMQGFYALALAGAGDGETARTQLDQVLLRDDLIGDVLYNVARCYALLGDKREAEMYLLQSLNVSPGPSEPEALLDPHFKSLSLSILLGQAVGSDRF